MIPQAMHELPELMTFIQQMKQDYERGIVRDWDKFSQLVRRWYTPERQEAIDDIVMGWMKMSSYADEQTLIHLTAALIALLTLPQYQALSPEDQNLALWIILYHDVAKEARHGKRDHTHAFRSAGVCGKGLVRQGKFVSTIDENALRDWFYVTQIARMYSTMYQDNIPDNRQLPEIMMGIDTLFGGRDTPAGLIICGVLFHMSFDVVDEYPQSAPLTNDEIQVYISPTLLPLLKVMMLTDNKAWALFDAQRTQLHTQQTLHEFERVEKLLA